MLGIEVHTAEPLVPGPSRFQTEIAIAKLKKCKSPGSHQIPAEMIQARGEVLLSAVHKLINSIWKRKNCLISGKSLLLYQFTKRVTKLTVIMGYQCYQQILSNVIPSNLSPYIDEIIGDCQCGFPRNGSTMIIFSAFVKHWRKIGVQ
jgi:hypothetical protein